MNQEETIFQVGDRIQWSYKSQDGAKPELIYGTIKSVGKKQVHVELSRPTGSPVCRNIKKRNIVKCN